MEYEICYLIGESKESNLDSIRPVIEGIITKHKGVFLEGEFVRKRRLAYVIKKEARGTYVARRFTIPSKDEREELYPEYDIMGEINKELRFNQDIIRFIIVKTQDLPPLKDLENIEEKKYSQIAQKENRIPQGHKNIINKKIDQEKVIKKDVEVVKPQEESEKKENNKNAKEEEKLISKDKIAEKKEKEDGILGDDIDEKLDKILNI